MRVNQVLRESNNKTMIDGGCLCGLVRFEIKYQFEHFYLCHCMQCKQLTGSAFAANIFTKPENIKWRCGYEKISFYQHPTRAFSKAFCSKCGCALPVINKSGQTLVIPAGSLLQAVDDLPEANIFVNEKSQWLSAGLLTKEFSHLPE